MRQLVIVRHANAASPEPGMDDFERRLDARGRREAATMAQRALELGLAPDHLIASPADRAVATAREFAKALGYPLARIRHDDRVYLAEPTRLVEILQAVPDAAARVMLVGHNPGLSQLAAWLTGEDHRDLPTAAIHASGGELQRWSDLYAGAFERLHLEWPR